jgi:Ser/Thr protein kinase RdoA (MazF antagonist)
MEERYGPIVELRPLDAGVLRVEWKDGSNWVTRVAPVGRSLADVEGDAAVLAFLADHDLPTERLACEDAVSEVAGRGVLVTQFVQGKQPAMAKPYTRQLGDMLGRLHALPPGPGAVSRKGGGWHSLSLEGGGRAVDIAVVDALLADKAPRADPVFIDWAGSGRSSRLANVAAVAYYLSPTAIKECLTSYRTHVTLELEELDHLEGTLGTHQLVLAAWGLAFNPSDAGAVASRLGGQGQHIRKQAGLIRTALR